MIKSVWVKNYRSIADIRVNLEPVTILVGHNGSGKSNFVDVFRFIYDTFRLGLDIAIANRDGMSAIRRWSAKGRPYEVEIGFTIETDTFTGVYSFTLGGERRGEYTVKREQCTIKESTTGQEVRYETNSGVWVYALKDITPSLTNRTLVLPLLATTYPYTMLYDYVTSFGTLRLFGILVALHQDDQRTLLALEEPKLTIHPSVLNVLWDEIEAAGDRSQVLVTTHSPDLLDLCQVEQLRVVEKVAGVTLIDPIDEMQRTAIQKRLFAPSELLRAQGLRRANNVVIFVFGE